MIENVCSTCDKRKHVHRVLGTNALTCRTCELQATSDGRHSDHADGDQCVAHASGMAACAICGRLRTVCRRQRTGTFLCDACYRREVVPRERCTVCGEQKLVHLRREEGPICSACHRRTLLREPCAVCHRTRPVNTRAPDGSAICATCYRRDFTREPCAVCGATRPVAVRTHDRAAVCLRCYEQRYHTPIAADGRAAAP